MGETDLDKTTVHTESNTPIVAAGRKPIPLITARAATQDTNQETTGAWPGAPTPAKPTVVRPTIIRPKTVEAKTTVERATTSGSLFAFEFGGKAVAAAAVAAAATPLGLPQGLP